MNLSPLEQRLINHVSSPGYRPAKPKTIARDLGLDEEEIAQMRRFIRRLVKTGSLRFGPRHMVLPPQLAGSADASQPANASPADSVKKNEVVGLYRRAAGGYGFVTPQATTSNATRGQRDRSADIFVPEFKSGDAADGDLVRVRLSRSRDQSQRLSGSIAEVLQRRTRRFVGNYRERAGKGYVLVDAEAFENDVLVGDAGAKNCRSGDKVVIEMVHFPSPTRDGEAVIVEVLGPRGQPGVDTQTIIHQFGLPGEFPSEVMEDARRSADRFDENDISARTDFTGETVVTIDPQEARDFDDAISLRRIEKDHWLLGVHIADVSHFVPLDSQLDIEARNRGTSVYLPDRVIPMLPEVISNNLASLQPDRVRYTMSVLIEYDPNGHFVRSELHRGAIRSAHRFNYEEIDEYLADDKPWKKRLSADVFCLLRDMHALAMILRAKRMRQGSIELTIPDVKILLDDDGRVRGAEIEKNTESHQLIEEFMLAANESVARRLAVDESLNLMRRIHEAPSPLKLRQLTEFVAALGLKSNSLESRFEIKRLIEETAGTPESAAVNVSVLRSMQKAIYSPREIGHYALNSDYYCHFTSPIRRYPDLVIHRMVGDVLDGKRPRDDFADLERLGQQCSELEQRAERAERDLIRLKLLNYLADKVGTTFDATVTGVEAVGLYCLCEPLPVDGLIPVDMLPRDRYYFDRTARALTGHRTGNSFRIGDRLRVKVALVDPDRRDLELELVGRLGVPHRAVAGKSETATKGKSKHSIHKSAAGNTRTGNRRSPKKSARRKRT